MARQIRFTPISHGRKDVARQIRFTPISQEEENYSKTNKRERRRKRKPKFLEIKCHTSLQLS